MSTRFISQDPLGQEANEPSENVYLYTDGSPTNATDPYGTSIQTPGTALGGGVGAVPGGFGAGPSDCAHKGPGLVEAGKCRSYKRLEETEEEIHKEHNEEQEKHSKRPCFARPYEYSACVVEGEGPSEGGVPLGPGIDMTPGDPPLAPGWNPGSIVPGGSPGGGYVYEPSPAFFG